MEEFWGKVGYAFSAVGLLLFLFRLKLTCFSAGWRLRRHQWASGIPRNEENAEPLDTGMKGTFSLEPRTWDGEEQPHHLRALSNHL